MVWWILCSVAYLAVAGFFLFTIVRLKRRLSGRKFYVKHPDRFKKEFGSFFTDVACSLLWPLQIIGLLFYGMKG